jgi:hypothetical protein
MTRPVPGWDPRPRLIERLWSRIWPYLLAGTVGPLLGIEVFAFVMGWP